MAQSLPDDFIRRSFYVIGLGHRLGDIFVTELNKSRRDSRAILLEMLPKIFATRPLTKQRAKYLEDLADLVAESRGEYISRFRIQFEKELAELVRGEFKKANEIFTSIPLDGEPDEEADPLIPLILGTGIFSGLTVDKWFSEFGRADRQRIHRGISAGVTNGRTPNQIARDLLGTASQGGRDGVLATSQNSARTLARTITTGVSSLARSTWAGRVSKKNRMDILEIYTAILDSRTTFICSRLHGSIFRVGEGAYPPMHPNCRSSRYPAPKVITDPKLLKVKGKDFAKDAKRRVGGVKWKGMSASEHSLEVLEEKKIWLRKNVGLPPEDLDWDVWFAQQPEDFQYDYLGKTRFEAWKKGNLEIDDFVSPWGRKWTLAELRHRGVI